MVGMENYMPKGLASIDAAKEFKIGTGLLALIGS